MPPVAADVRAGSIRVDKQLIELAELLIGDLRELIPEKLIALFEGGRCRRGVIRAAVGHVAPDGWYADELALHEARVRQILYERAVDIRAPHEARCGCGIVLGRWIWDRLVLGLNL